jgi:putative transposase
MGSIGDCFDNSVAESFFGTLQLEPLDEQAWTANSSPSLSSTGSKPGTTRAAGTPTARMLSPIDYETTQASTGGASRRVLCHNS